jgi:hypothetical protein
LKRDADESAAFTTQDVNMANAQGNTALHWACVNGHCAVVEKLLAAGAKTTVCNAGERTALEEAMHNDRQVRTAHTSFPFPERHAASCPAPSAGSAQFQAPAPARRH